MADEVVDIRRRITEMRNEVSAAIVSNRDVVAASRAVGDRANISFGQPASGDNKDVTESHDSAVQRNEPKSTSINEPISDETVATYKALEAAAKMPAFQLNVRNQASNRLLLVVIGIQVMTNVLLVTVLWTKLG